MKRRQFIAGLGSAAAWPLGVRAQQSQQPSMPMIGFLGIDALEPRIMDAFRRGLAQAGYVEGQNVAIELRWANFQGQLLPGFAADLVRRNANVIVATGAIGPALTAKAATSTIPIVFANGADPVRYGLVASLNRPGGNVTGVSFLTLQLSGKRLDLLRALVPKA